MAEIKFSYKEAITHGWAMVKKNLGLIFLISFLFILFNVLNSVMQNFAGSGNITQLEVNRLIKDKAQAIQLYGYLQESGYINTFGSTQDKLQKLTKASDLILPLELSSKRFEIYQFLNNYRYRLPFPKPVYYLLIFTFLVLGWIMTIGSTKMSLMMSRDETPEIGELFSNGHMLIPYLLGGICYGATVLFGLILLIVPGIIFMFMFQMYFYLIIDKGLGPIASLKRSRVITKGSWGRLAVLGLLLMLLNLGGLLCLGVGLFITIPISSIAMAYVYDCLEKADENIVTQ